MKKAIALTMSVIIMATMLTSCCCVGSDFITDSLTSTIKERLLIGSWESNSNDVVMDFYEDGTGELESDGYKIDTTWRVEDGLLYMEIELLGLTREVYDGVEFNVDFTSLSIDAPEKWVYFTRVS